MIEVRHATLKDLDAITEIYNNAILKTNATFDTAPKTLVEQEQWFKSHGPENPIMIALIQGKIIGWAALSKWSDRCAYSKTAEVSLYLKEEFQGKGFGRQLLHRLMIEGEKAGLRTIIARITEGNDISIHLHEALGFEHIGVMKKVGEKFGKILDVYLMQKVFDKSSL